MSERVCVCLLALPVHSITMVSPLKVSVCDHLRAYVYVCVYVFSGKSNYVDNGSRSIVAIVEWNAMIEVNVTHKHGPRMAKMPKHTINDSTKKHHLRSWLSVILLLFGANNWCFFCFSLATHLYPTLSQAPIHSQDIPFIYSIYIYISGILLSKSDM